MNRKELYDSIVSLGLQEEVKSVYGKNYTNCKTEELAHIVGEALESLQEAETCPCLSKLVEILQKKKILLKSEVEYIMQ